MRCPYCQGNDTSVVDTRPSPTESIIRRRRECPDCKVRFSTWERVEWRLPQVEKKNRQLESFNRNKIAQGIATAVKKRDIPVEKIDRVIDELEQMISQQKKEQISSNEIGALVLKRLFSLDQVSALRFASVYLRFDDLDSFNELIDKIRVMPSPETERAQYRLIGDADEDQSRQ